MEFLSQEDASRGDYLYLTYKKKLEEATEEISKIPPVEIAIFGLGRIGTIHLENLCRNPRVNIRYCIEELTERASFLNIKRKLVESKFLKPAQQQIVFEDKRIDAVVICTPTFTHESLVLKALQSGKAVFCEKPLSLEEEGIERCINAAEKYNKPLLCAFNRRFDPGFRSLKDRVDAGEIGTVHVIKTCSRDSPKPSVDYLKISGGIFHDCAVHDIDYICWVLGEFPESVSSFAHAYFEDIKELGDYDTVGIMMKFPSGAIALIDLSRQAVYGYDQRVEIFGTKGMLTCREQRPTANQCHSSKGTTSLPIFFSFASRYHEAYVFEMMHFLDVAQGLKKCEISGESILAVSKIASACEDAVKTGNSIILKWHEFIKKSL